ncbi:MAG TPA: hypothetical protein VH164_06815 [Ktedonobacteraceae bacterium]|jgi:hypothetical protein|nr:hypothetical protein [Ktedonobacteraceae bacterium]
MGKLNFEVQAMFVPRALLQDIECWEEFCRLNDVMFWDESEYFLDPETIGYLVPVLLYRRLPGEVSAATRE